MHLVAAKMMWKFDSTVWAPPSPGTPHSRTLTSKFTRFVAQVRAISSPCIWGMQSETAALTPTMSDHFRAVSTSKFLTAVGLRSGEPECFALRGPVERQISGQQRAVGQRRRLTSLYNCRDNVGREACQTSQFSQARAAPIGS